MKAIIEIPILNINILTAEEVLSVINNNSALTEILMWFSGDDPQDLSKINCFFNYVISRTNGMISFSYIVDSQIEKLEELTLFLSVICKEHFVNRATVAADKLAKNIAKLLMLCIPANQYYFYKDFPKFHDHKIELLPEYQDNKNIQIYGLNEDNTNFDIYILHTIITDFKRNFFAKIINQQPEVFINNSCELRQKIIQHNKNMMNNSTQINIQNIVCNISAKLYKFLVAQVNFK